MAPPNASEAGLAGGSKTSSRHFDTPMNAETEGRRRPQSMPDRRRNSNNGQRTHALQQQSSRDSSQRTLSSNESHATSAAEGGYSPARSAAPAPDPKGHRLRYARMGSLKLSSMRSTRSVAVQPPPPPGSTSGPQESAVAPTASPGTAAVPATVKGGNGGGSNFGNGHGSFGSLGPLSIPEDYVDVNLCLACWTCPSLMEIQETLNNAIVQGQNACSVSEPDSGRLPLHFIGLNRDLILFSTGGVAASIARVDDFILRELLPEHPSAIIHEDDEGRIPFTEVILRWIKARRAARDWQTVTERKRVEREKKSSMASKVARRFSMTSQVDSDDDDDDNDDNSLSIKSLDGDLRQLCGEDGEEDDDQVHDLPPLVEWSLRMLSSVIDRPTVKNQLGCTDSNVALRTERMGGVGGGGGGGGMGKSVRNLDVDFDSDASSTEGGGGSTVMGRMRRRGSEGSSRPYQRRRRSPGTASMQTGFIYDEIVVEKVASISNLVEELLLIKDKSARKRVFELSIVHKVMFCPSSLGDGKWFIDMLTRGIRVNMATSHGGSSQDDAKGKPSHGSKERELNPSVSTPPRMSSQPRRSSLHRTNSMQRAASLLGKPTLTRTGSVLGGLGMGDSEDESGVYAEASVFYLEAISHLHLQDDLDVLHHMQMLQGGQPRGGLIDMVGGSDLRHFRKKRDKLYDAVAGLDGLIRFICVLDDDLLSRAALTPVIQRKLDKKIFSPFSMTIAFFDGIVHILLVVSFRLGPAPALFHLSPIDASFRPQQYLIANMVLILCVTHFALKEVHLGLAKYALSPRLFWSDALTFWNLLDIVPLFMTAFGSIAVDHVLRQRAGGTSEDSTTIPFYLRVAIASTTPFLWLRLLGHIKMWNKQLATFILCSVEIMKDIKWFMLVLLIAIASFAQMFVSLTYEPSVVDGDVQPDQYALEGYLKAYTIMLGDFDALSMQEHPSITLLFIFYTFGVTIVLLNVLIAIVSDSYANASVSSKTMLGKARVMFLAELSSLKNFHRMWSRGEMISLERNINLAAIAFGALTTKFLADTVKAKLGRLGQTSLFKEDDNSSDLDDHTAYCEIDGSTDFYGPSASACEEDHSSGQSSFDSRQLDIEAWLLFAFFSCLFYAIKITMIHIQQAFDDRGLGLSAEGKGKGVAAASQSDKWTIDYYVERICNFVTKGIDHLAEDDDGKLLEESAESASGGEGTNSKTDASLNKLHKSMNANRKEFKSELKHTADELRHSVEESEHHSQDDMMNLEERLTSALAENQGTIAAMIAASEERLLQAMLKLENGKGGTTGQ